MYKKRGSRLFSALSTPFIKALVASHRSRMWAAAANRDLRQAAAQAAVSAHTLVDCRTRQLNSHVLHDMVRGTERMRWNEARSRKRASPRPLSLILETPPVEKKGLSSLSSLSSIILETPAKTLKHHLTERNLTLTWQ